MKGQFWTKRLAGLLLGLVLFCGASVVAAAPVASPPIRIGLMTQQFGILASSNGGFQVVNVDDGKILGEFTAGAKLRIGLREGKFVINNAIVNSDRMRIEPQKPKNIEREDRLLEINNRRYRGAVEIFRTQGAAGMTAVNVLPLDEYVYGVLGLSLTPEWPEQAVKAQAVVVRSFALYHSGKHNNEGFDLCDTGDCLVYEGQTQENPKIWQAIEATRGLALLYQNYPVAAY